MIRKFETCLEFILTWTCFSVLSHEWYQDNQRPVISSMAPQPNRQFISRSRRQSVVLLIELGSVWYCLWDASSLEVSGQMGCWYSSDHGDTWLGCLVVCRRHWSLYYWGASKCYITALWNYIICPCNILTPYERGENFFTTTQEHLYWHGAMNPVILFDSSLCSILAMFPN